MSRQLRIAGLALLALGLCSCVEATGEMAAVEGRRDPVAAREGVAIDKASVAIVSAVSDPGEPGQAFLAALTAGAGAHDVKFADAKSAKYLVQAYVSGERTEGGAEYAYVMEVFTAGKSRAHRIDDAVAVKGGGDDIWGAQGDKAIKSLAERGADDLFAFLTTTPEAAAPGAAKPAAGKAGALLSQN